MMVRDPEGPRTRFIEVRRARKASEKGERGESIRLLRMESPWYRLERSALRMDALLPDSETRTRPFETAFSTVFHDDPLEILGIYPTAVSPCSSAISSEVLTVSSRLSARNAAVTPRKSATAANPARYKDFFGH